MSQSVTQCIKLRCVALLCVLFAYLLCRCILSSTSVRRKERWL